MLKIIESWLEERQNKKLVRACLGNKDKAARLVTYEKSRNKWLTRRQAINLAFERLEEDRSR